MRIRIISLQSAVPLTEVRPLRHTHSVFSILSHANYVYYRAPRLRAAVERVCVV